MKSVEGCTLSQRYENILCNEEAINKDKQKAENDISNALHILEAVYESKCFIDGKIPNNSEAFKKIAKKGNPKHIIEFINKN